MTTGKDQSFHIRDLLGVYKKYSYYHNGHFNLLDSHTAHIKQRYSNYSTIKFPSLIDQKHWIECSRIPPQDERIVVINLLESIV